MGLTSQRVQGRLWGSDRLTAGHLPVRPTLVVVGLAVGLALGGCNDEVRDASRELAGRLASQEHATQERSLATRDSLPSCRIDSSDVQLESGIRLYLDASQSMAGFTGGRSRATRFDNVLDRISSLAGLSELTLFGRPSEDAGDILTRVPFGTDLHRRSTFVRTHNPDFCLFRAIERTGGDGVHLYLSDGVQSAVRFGVPSPTAVALDNWLAEGNSLAILAFRSEFEGRAWSEQLREWVGRVSVEERPFYLYVLAQDEAALDRVLEDRLGPEDFDGEVELFRFVPDPLRCRVEATGRYEHQASNPAWSFLTSSQQERLQSSLGEVATVRCDRPSGYPLAEVLARVESDYWPWSTAEKSFEGPERSPPGTNFTAEPVSEQASGGFPHVKIQGRAPDDSGTRFGLYHLSLEMHPGTLTAEVAELTTDSDADPENFDRTYRFDWLLEHLVRGQMARSAPREDFFLTLTYR